MDKIIKQREINLETEISEKINEMKPIFLKIKTKFTKCLSVGLDDEGQFARYALSPGKKLKKKNL